MAELINQTYQKKTDKEHILDNEDTYTGSMEISDNSTYIFNDGKIVEETIKMIPGLYKLFDEAAVNSRDHVVRMNEKIKTQSSDELNHRVSFIDIAITDDKIISFTNDGNGIDVIKHPTYDIWVPEMIFGHLRTSTNYDKKQKKIVGGKNGFGVKLIFIWSEWGQIETVDHIRQLKYVQTFKNNLDIIDPPVITKCKRKPYTKISFKPDFKRLKIQNLCIMKSLFKKRVYDMTAVTDKSIKVKYNGEIIPIKTFQNYLDLYIGDKTQTPRVHECYNDRWEYAVCITPYDEFKQVSFVNGIYTKNGGKHIDYIMNQIVKKLIAYIYKKKKVTVKSSSIKEQIMLFLRCDIENPGFDSQTKETMNTPIGKFGSTCVVSDGFIDKISKLGIMDIACKLTDIKSMKDASKSDGSKNKSLRGVPKLVDANCAGTNKSSKCTIIFCEGDSAKSGIVSGLSREDRDYIGVYPLKGKLFNVRGAPIKTISSNNEITEIKKILGLEVGKSYNSIDDITKYLRYGQIWFMTDQDKDGSHIKGLCINLFENMWESIIKLNIIGFMNTPILKATKGQEQRLFYNDGEYIDWLTHGGGSNHGWKIKYYKGLGTSTAKEFKQYFKDKKVVMFTYDETSNDDIDMVFNKKRADDRKVWLGKYDRTLFVDTNKTDISYTEFIHKELRHYSKYDCDRSIPNIMDGLKTSQRKILFSAFKKNLVSEIKVAQFSGYVSEQSCYHHGEASLNGAIVGMAQDYVGSCNNINILMPNGQFGTRLSGGKDSASERYIFTQLNPVTKIIFNEMDNAVLRYLDDDGTPVEPIYYAPIIPMCLVNGIKGIGTGFSTYLPCYNPVDITKYVIDYLRTGASSVELTPYYNNFTGTITKITPSKYLIKGKYEKIANNKIKITELPIGTWTDDYKEHLEKLIEQSKKDGIVKNYIDMSTDKNIDFTILFCNTTILQTLESNKIDDHCTELEKYLNLYTTKSTSNMHLFDQNERLVKFNTVEEIIHAYIEQRLKLYTTRIQNIINQLNQEVVLLTNKAKYILEVIKGSVDLRNKKGVQIIQLLKDKSYDIINEDKEYKYLIKLPMDSVSHENVEKLLKKKGDKESELEVIKNMTNKKMWISELNALYKILSTSTMPSSTKKKKLKIAN